MYVVSTKGRIDHWDYMYSEMTFMTNAVVVLV